MNYRYIYSGILFLIVGIATYFARTLGWYNDYWFTDVTLHVISGAAFGLMWVGVNKNITQLPFFILALGTISFAVFGSVLWEFWEFFGWRITPSHTRFYIPELGDTLNDLFCGLVGGMIVSMANHNIFKSIKK